MGNLFDLPEVPVEREFFETLAEERDLRIERIVSSGHVTPAGQWYDQDLDEWVALLQGLATLVFDDGTRMRLKPGDYVLIPAHRRHRVERTSTDPPCIWVAVHGNLVSASSK